MLDDLPPNPWFSRPLAVPHAALRYWCFPYAGGGAAAWHPWARLLAPVAEIVAIRLPGRESRLAEPAIPHLGELATHLAAALAPHTHRPYALGGHSLGALLAYEVARRLRRAGHPPPVAFVASGARAPHCPRTDPNLHHLPDDEFIAQVDQRYQGIPPALLAHREFLDLLIPALRADLQAFETYVHSPEPPFDFPTLALGGEADPRVSPAQSLAWRDHTTASFESAFFPGGHFFPTAQLDAVTTRLKEFFTTTRPPA